MSERSLSIWFEKHGVKGGEWYGEAKEFTRKAAQANLSEDAAAVLMALRLCTVAYKSEKAVKQVLDPDTKKTKLVSVTPQDLVEATGKSRQHVRNGLAEIEVKGFGKRKAVDGGALRKGAVEIYCWTVPRPPAKEKIVAGSSYKVSNEINKIAWIADLHIPKGFVATPGYKEAVEQAYLSYKEATIVAQEALKQALFVAPGAPAYKDERKYLKESTERGDGQSVSQPVEEDRPTDPPEPAPPQEEPLPEPPAPSLETSKPAEEMETLILQEAGPQFPGEVPGRSLCLQVIQILADTPWDEFRQKLRGRKWKRDDSMGLTRSLAQEVRDRWIRDADRRTSPARGQPACTICTQPLNGGVVIQGAHFACHNNAKGASG